MYGGCREDGGRDAGRGDAGEGGGVGGGGVGGTVLGGEGGGEDLELEFGWRENKEVGRDGGCGGQSQ